MDMVGFLIPVVTGLVLGIFGLLLRIAFVMGMNTPGRNRRLDLISYNKEPKNKKVKTMIIMGSGGHTMEMLKILSGIDKATYNPRCYVLAESDIQSAQKVATFESETDDEEGSSPKYTLERIPRSRRVGQSYISSVFTTILSCVYCIPVILQFKPDLVLCNGPGTCIPICLLAFLLKVFAIHYPVIVYVESICRVQTLSLSGKILLYFGDYVLVQWPELQEKYPQTQYVGRML